MLEQGSRVNAPFRRGVIKDSSTAVRPTGSRNGFLRTGATAHVKVS